MKLLTVTLKTIKWFVCELGIKPFQNKAQLIHKNHSRSGAEAMPNSHKTLAYIGVFLLSIAIPGVFFNVLLPPVEFRLQSVSDVKHQTLPERPEVLREGFCMSCLKVFRV